MFRNDLLGVADLPGEYIGEINSSTHSNSFSSIYSSYQISGITIVLKDLERSQKRVVRIKMWFKRVWINSA